MNESERTEGEFLGRVLNGLLLVRGLGAVWGCWSVEGLGWSVWVGRRADI
jgi:hypothetical protein